LAVKIKKERKKENDRAWAGQNRGQVTAHLHCRCKQVQKIQVENDRAWAGQNRGQVTAHLHCGCKQVQKIHLDNDMAGAGQNRAMKTEIIWPRLSMMYHTRLHCGCKQEQKTRYKGRVHGLAKIGRAHIVGVNKCTNPGRELQDRGWPK
jgi:hypothetical protein